MYKHKCKDKHKYNNNSIPRSEGGRAGFECRSWGGGTGKDGDNVSEYCRDDGCIGKYRVFFYTWPPLKSSKYKKLI